MPFQFTRHAVERYMQFYLMDDQADERDVKVLLEAESVAAYKLPDKTYAGDIQWRIDALGCDLVTRCLEGGVGVDVVVTILPPPALRGYTPQQAERVSEYLKRIDQRKKEVALLRDRLAREQTHATKKGATVGERAKANLNNERLSELNELRACLNIDREIMLDVMRTVRQKLLIDERRKCEMKRKTAQALRAVLDLARAAEPSDLRDAIYRAVYEVEPVYLSDFLEGE